MAKFAHIQVIGGRELAAEMKRTAVDVQQGRKDMRAMHKRAADIVAKEAKKRAPTLKTRRGTTSGYPGQLRASIQSSAGIAFATVRSGKKDASFTSEDFVYAPIIEFGWPGHNIEPQPHMYPALAATRPDVLDVYADGIEDILQRHFPGGVNLGF